MHFLRCCVAIIANRGIALACVVAFLATAAPRAQAPKRLVRELDARESVDPAARR